MIRIRIKREVPVNKLLCKGPQLSFQDKTGDFHRSLTALFELHAWGITIAYEQS